MTAADRPEHQQHKPGSDIEQLKTKTREHARTHHVGNNDRGYRGVFEFAHSVFKTDADLPVSTTEGLPVVACSWICSGGRRQSLVQIRKNVVNMLDTDAETNHVRRNTGCFQFIFGELPMRR